jgi:hypothetical protein
MGTRIEQGDLFSAPYPEAYVVEPNVVDRGDFEGLDPFEGKLLCVDAYAGQMLFSTMVNGCND